MTDSLRSLLQRLAFRTIVILNYGLVIVASGIGWISASHSGANIGFAEMHQPLTGTVWGDFLHIAKWNVSLAGGMLLGVSTLGAFTLLELVWNGIHHGFDLYLLFHGCRPALIIFLRYALLEISSLTLIAAASQALALRIVRNLIFNDEVGSLRPILMALLAGFSMLMTAAAIEAKMKPLLQIVGCG